MNWRGGLSYLGSVALGAEWRRCLQEIRFSSPERIREDYEEILLEHAATRVPYYESLGLASHELCDFPILTRRVLRERFGDLKSRDAQARACSRACTGGSTGEPVWVMHDRGFRHWLYATDMYCLSELLGIPYQDYLRQPRVAVWHRRPVERGWPSMRDGIVRLLGQVTFLEPYAGMDDETLRAYLAAINRKRPLVIWGFSGYLYELARLAKSENIRVHRPRAIVASVEMLYPRMRELIQEVFGCRVHDRYGAAEVGRVAGECRRGNLHSFSFASHAEVLTEDGRPAGPGEEGRLVITALHNLAMPLIRYDIGDMAKRPTSDCSCGSPLPLLGTIRGRVMEHFVAPDGRVIYGGYFVAMFYEHPWISGFQVVQEDFDRVAVFYRTMPGHAPRAEAIEELTKAIRSAMGDHCRVRWTEVEEVPRSPIGKHLHIRSLVWEERERSRT